MPPETDAAGLAADVLAASTPKAATAAVSSVVDFLRRHAGDHPRAFFADALPSLLFRLFVCSPTSPSFIDLAAGDAALADFLASLLSPSGPLLAAVFASDRHSLLRFVFPPERLPGWLRLALSSAAASSSDEVLSPLLAGRIGSELHLSVFEYYLFWFAYYPISAATATATAGGGTSQAWPSTFRRRPSRRCATPHRACSSGLEAPGFPRPRVVPSCSPAPPIPSDSMVRATRRARSRGAIAPPPLSPSFLMLGGVVMNWFSYSQ